MTFRGRNVRARFWPRSENEADRRDAALADLEESRRAFREIHDTYLAAWLDAENEWLLNPVYTRREIPTVLLVQADDPTDIVRRSILALFADVGRNYPEWRCVEVETGRYRETDLRWLGLKFEHRSRVAPDDVIGAPDAERMACELFGVRRPHCWWSTDPNAGSRSYDAESVRRLLGHSTQYRGDGIEERPHAGYCSQTWDADDENEPDTMSFLEETAEAIREFESDPVEHRTELMKQADERRTE